MSERVTWETCPECGGPVAIGWEADLSDVGCPTGVGPGRPIEFDCLNGCQLSRAELAAFAVGRTGASGGRLDRARPLRDRPLRD